MGESQRFRRLYLRYHNELFGYLCHMLRSSSIAESMVQETFLKLLDHIHDLEDAQIKSWLYKTATRLALNHQRSQKRRHSWHQQALQQDALPMDQGNQLDPEQKWIEREEAEDNKRRKELALRAQEKLSARQVSLLQLKFSGMSYAEIADALDVQTSSVSRLLIRAKQAFQKAYQELERAEG